MSLYSCIKKVTPLTQFVWSNAQLLLNHFQKVQIALLLSFSGALAKLTAQFGTIDSSCDLKLRNRVTGADCERLWPDNTKLELVECGKDLCLRELVECPSCPSGWKTDGKEFSPDVLPILFFRCKFEQFDQTLYCPISSLKYKVLMGLTKL